MKKEIFKERRYKWNTILCREYVEGQNCSQSIKKSQREISRDIWHPRIHYNTPDSIISALLFPCVWICLLVLISLVCLFALIILHVVLIKSKCFLSCEPFVIVSFREVWFCCIVLSQSTLYLFSCASD